MCFPPEYEGKVRWIVSEKNRWRKNRGVTAALIKINYTLMTSFYQMIVNLAQLNQTSAKRRNGPAKASTEKGGANLVGFPFLDGFESADPVLHFLPALGA